MNRLPTLYRIRYILAEIILIATAAVLYLLLIGGVPTGISDSEIETLSRVNQDLAEFLENPIHLWQSLWLNLNVSVWGYSGAALRAANVVFAFAFFISFYYAMKMLYWRRFAFSSTLLLVTSSIGLHLFRHITTNVGAPLGLMILILGLQLIRLGHRPRIGTYLVALGILIGIYSPLFIYGLLAVGIIFRSTLSGLLKSHDNSLIAAGGTIVAVGLIPFVLGIVSQEGFATEILGLPSSFSFADIWQNIGIYGSSFLGQPDTDIEFRNFKAGYLSLAGLTLLFLGLVEVVTHRSSTRSKLLIALLVVIGLALSLNLMLVNLAILIPVLSWLGALGIKSLLGRWNGVFPKNPIARASAFIPLVLLFGSIGWFSFESYFTAWPNNSEFYRTYDRSTDLLSDALEKNNSGGKTAVVSNDDNLLANQLLVADTAMIISRTDIDSVNFSSFDQIYIAPELETLVLENDVLKDYKLDALVDQSRVEPIKYLIYSR